MNKFCCKSNQLIYGCCNSYVTPLLLVIHGCLWAVVIWQRLLLYKLIFLCLLIASRWEGKLWCGMWGESYIFSAFKLVSLFCCCFMPLLPNTIISKSITHLLFWPRGMTVDGRCTLKLSRTGAVCMTCNHFRYALGKQCQSLLTSPTQQCLILWGDYLNSKCSHWAKRRYLDDGCAPEVALITKNNGAKTNGD
mgnify:CR=1 FL=1